MFPPFPRKIPRHNPSWFTFILLAALTTPVMGVEKKKDKASIITSPKKEETKKPATMGMDAALQKKLTEQSEQVLTAFKQQDGKTLEKFVHPDKGVRFTPYSYIEPKQDVVIPAKDFAEFFKSKKKYEWGAYDGSGAPIQLTPAEYVKKFVYNADFLKAKAVNWNKMKGVGNSLENQDKIYPGAHIVEYYFPGFDPQFGGMDWKALRLVWEKKGDQWYLVGVIHNEWTT